MFSGDNIIKKVTLTEKLINMDRVYCIPLRLSFFENDLLSHYHYTNFVIQNWFIFSNADIPEFNLQNFLWRMSSLKLDLFCRFVRISFWETFESKFLDSTEQHNQCYVPINPFIFLLNYFYYLVKISEDPLFFFFCWFFIHFY